MLLNEYAQETNRPIVYLDEEKNNKISIE